MNKIISLFMLAAAALLFTSCEDDKSYTKLLNDESKDVNRFLADHRIITEIPSDTVFETGPDAPYYQLDSDGKIFMQVLEPGFGPKVKTNQLVYFRFDVYSLKGYESPDSALVEIRTGNNNVGFQSVFFRYGDTLLPSTTEWGMGIQAPLQYLPLNSHVRIAMKAEFGLSEYASYATPQLWDIRYFPSKL